MFSKKSCVALPSIQRKQSFMLVEVVIATILVGILAIAALGLLYQCFQTSRYYEKALEREEIHMARIIKLRSILRSIKKGAKDPFYVVKDHGSDHLFFSCFSGNRYEPEGSNERYGQLYVNEKQELVFVYSSHTSKNAIHPRSDHAVVLWPNIKKLTFQFMQTQKQQTSLPNSNPSETGRFLENWEKEWNSLPAVIVASLQEKDGKEPIKVSSIVLSSLQEISVS